MSLAAWYYHKADQCARLAKDAIEPRKRSDFETERKLWLQIAEQIEMDEVGWFGPVPMGRGRPPLRRANDVQRPSNPAHTPRPLFFAHSTFAPWSGNAETSRQLRNLRAWVCEVRP